jgi:hypothetical protein
MLFLLLSLGNPFRKCNVIIVRSELRRSFVELNEMGSAAPLHIVVMGFRSSPEKLMRRISEERGYFISLGGDWKRVQACPQLRHTRV